MKILFTLYDLQNLGGTETYTYSLGRELINQGHSVYCYSSKLGEVVKNYVEAGINVVDDINELPEDIDVIHAQHRMEATVAALKYPKTPMIFISHGILPWQEQPLPFSNIFRYVAVSEEVANHLENTYGINHTKIRVIRNGIDLERFYPVRPINTKPKSLLLISNRYTDDVKKVLEETCQILGIDFKILGNQTKGKWDVESEINETDIVVSLGRGILEAMACGRIALVFDYNGGEGIVTPSNYKDFRKFNFSGRFNKFKFNADQLVKELNIYSRELADSNLNIVREHHDIKSIAREFILLYQEAIQNHVAPLTFDLKELVEVINNSYKYIGKELIQKESNTKYLLEVIEEEKQKEKKSMEIFNELEKLKKEHFDRTERLHEKIDNYQEKISSYQEEIERYINRINESEMVLRQKESELASILEQTEGNFHNIIAEKEEELKQKEANTKYLMELTQEKNRELNSIYNSNAWKLITKYRRGRELLGKAVKDPSKALKRVIGGKSYNPNLSTTNKNVLVQNSDRDPLVSVIIPIYDRTDVLVESIESILKQTFDDFELLLVCDGSPKQTLDIVKKYEGNPKVRAFYFNNNSGNAVRGRNKGIIEARGKYLAFQDSDDIAEKNRLETSVEYMEKYNVDVVYGGWRALVDGSRQIDINDQQEVYSPDCDYKMLKEICVPCQSTVMVRLEAIRSVGGLKTKMRYREDHELWLRMAYKGYKFKAIPRILTNLRLHANNLELTYKDTDDHWYNLMIEEHKVIPKLKPKIAYVIPGCGISGGIAVICQHANRLLNRGYDVILVSEDDKTEINWFPNQLVQIVPLDQIPKNLDVVVATGWSTAYTIEGIQAKRKIYFVQSDESRFYPKGSKEYFAAIDSYKFDYEYMTEAKWIQKWLKDNYNRDSYYVPNGLDEQIIHQTEPLYPKTDKVRVLLEGPIDIPFKGMAEAFEAVKDLDCEIWCISSAGKPKAEWKCDYFFEKVPMEKMKNIYSSCDIFLKMSRVEGFFGPPLEMMACGGACVVGEVTGYDEYIEHGYNAMVVKQGDIEGAKQAVKQLIENIELREKIIENGRKTANEWKWEPTIDILESIFHEK